MEISMHLNKAFRILRRNYSCPGSDGLSYRVIKRDFIQHRNFLESSLKDKTFKFTEPRNCLVNTGVITKKIRNIFVYNIYDRWIQETIRIELNNYLKDLIHPHVYSYIRGKSRRQAFEFILNCNPKFILIVDLKDFAGSIKVSKLFSMLEQINVPFELLDMIHQSIKHAERGLPKGNSITSILSNFYLTPIDNLFQENYCRFSDDLIFALKNQNQIKEIVAKMQPYFNTLGLKLNREKLRFVQNGGNLKIINEYPWIINH